MDLEAKDAPMEDLGDPFHQVEVVDVDDADAGADTPNKEGAPQEGVEIKDAAEDMSEAKASHHCHNKPITGDPEKESNLEDLQDIAKELDEISEEVPGQAQQADQEEPALPESSAQIPVIQKLPTEQEEHPFAVYYCAESSEEWPRHPAAQAVESITLAQIQKARNATIAAITDPHTVRERPRREDTKIPSKFVTTPDYDQDMIFAVVVYNLGASLVVTPVKREYAANDRGDLYQMLINEYSFDYMTYAKKAFFNVGNFAVFQRHISSPLPIAVTTVPEQGHRLGVVVYGVTKIVRVKPAQLRAQPQGKQLFARVFSPGVEPGQLLRRIRSGESHTTVLRLTAPVSCKWNLPPIITEFREGDEKDLEISPLAFSYDVTNPNAAYAQSYSSTFGVYGAIALQGKNEDLRSFLATVEDIETVRDRVKTFEHEPRRAHLCARLLSAPIPLNDVSEVVVRQHSTEKGDLARLAPQLRNIPSVNGDNNAMRALATLSGADTLPPLPPQNVDLNANRTVHDLTLSDQQMRIINTLSSNNFTALAIDCGPGTGKTTTLILAVLSRLRQITSISVMASMSNSAVTAAVARLLKIDKNKECRAVRLITAKNWLTIEYEHKTPIDFPIRWTEFFLELVASADNTNKSSRKTLSQLPSTSSEHHTRNGLVGPGCRTIAA
uniref:DNA2/NAM7 helicase helicase domain-containing protein n=1 Tax=Caenorhabditis japonica TaxID=281687 RepID=A0A8R1DX61_CAEJA